MENIKMKTITSQFSDNIPDTEGLEAPEGYATDDQRDGTKRRLFSMCVCHAENEGLPDKFTCIRTVTEEKQEIQGMKFITLTVKAEFTEVE